ncbi:hypothetical protein G6F31_020949 [Rhizopus arrhizus]|nr:hypothetical protein G6F31_020949 [Rhizopus arrhizus]
MRVVLHRPQEGAVPDHRSDDQVGQRICRAQAPGLRGQMPVQHGQQRIHVREAGLGLPGIPARLLSVGRVVHPPEHGAIRHIAPRAPRHGQQPRRCVRRRPQPRVHAIAFSQPQLDRQGLEHRRAIHRQRRHLAQVSDRQ